MDCLSRELFHPALNEPGWMRVSHRQFGDPVLWELLLPQRAAVLQSPQDGVDEGPRAAPGQLDSFVHRRVGRDLAQIKKLVGPEPEEVPDIQVYPLERTIQNVGEKEVNGPSMPQHPVAELRRQCPVARGQPLPIEPGVQEQIGVRPIPLDPDEHFQGEASRIALGSRRKHSRPLRDSHG